MKRFENVEWMEKMRIRLDVNNMFAQQIGEEHGITQQIVESDPYVKSAFENLCETKNRGILGFSEIVNNQEETVQEILRFVQQSTGKYTSIVVLGIGGSALGIIALQKALNPFYYNEYVELRKDKPKLYVLDNVDPEWLGEFFDLVNLKSTLFLVISKSGGTAETLSQYMIIRKLYEKQALSIQKHLVFITSEGKGNLIKIARDEGIRAFYIPENVGGRFSVLSVVGLLPAAFVGIDIEELLAGARYMDKICLNQNIWENPAYLSAALQYLSYRKGKTISIMFPYSTALKDIADWYAQLWAESLGKKVNRDGEIVNVGPTPFKALGVTDQHSQVQLYMEGPYDKVVTFIEVENFRREIVIPELHKEIPGLTYLNGHTLNELITIEKRATELALTKNMRLNNTIVLPEINAFTVGQLIQLFELQTAFAGEMFEINAFDQPGVELGKEYTYGILGHESYIHMKFEYEKKVPKNSTLII